MIPVYNEAHRIHKTLKAVKGEKSLDFLFVDDGSTDETPDLIEKAGLVVIRQPHCGKGVTVRVGLFHACNEASWVGVMDADMSVPFSVFKRLRTNAQSRMLYYGERNYSQRKLGRWLFSQAFRVVRGLLFGVWVKDTQCPMKFAHMSVMDSIRRKMKLKGFAFDVEYFIHYKNIKAVPVVYQDVGGSSVHVVRTGWQMFKELVQLRLKDVSIRTIMRWKYVKFVCVGAVGTLISGAVLYSLTEWLHWYYMISFLCGAFVGSINNYLMNKHWVFK